MNLLAGVNRTAEHDPRGRARGRMAASAPSLLAPRPASARGRPDTVQPPQTAVSAGLTPAGDST
jgi:hypothetical protein